MPMSSTARAFSAVAAAIVTCLAIPGISLAAGPPSVSCTEAVAAAERRYAIPTGMLFAIGLVESGRTDPASGDRRPFPWTVNANNEDHFFDTKLQAVKWVRAAQARGQASIDVGCLQVNLFFHPQAFASLEEAFEPSKNVDYAARFLVALKSRTGDWTSAIGQYHSQTPALALPYRNKVALAMSRTDQGKSGFRLQPNRHDSALAALAAAWNATMDAKPAGHARAQD